ncbi:MAG: hypothetical protein EP348_13035 [Alphaproteobacteria bacterium]|nr:MAG: hypothetical protein EP348_13035 [Alphaproteobacteria bacterium]
MEKKEKKPSRQVVIKFCLLLTLLGGYFAYLSYEYDILTGGISSLLTWSFFVLCTPVADAGFLLDFPMRLLFGVRMVFSELAVWAIAISLNLYTYFKAPHYYETTLLTKVFHRILSEPYPYWGVILLSMVGTFLSIRFGDELMDVLHHRDRNFFHSHHFKQELVLVGFFLIAIFAYYELIRSLHLEGAL